MIIKIFFRLLPIFCLLGCTKIYWDENWIYEGIVTVPQEQVIRIESVPPSPVWLDGNYAGETPLEIRLPYSISQIRTLKQQYRETSGIKEVLDQKERVLPMPQPVSHVLHLKAPGYQDAFVPLEIPSEKAEIQVTLKKKTSAHCQIDCRLSFKTRKSDLETIGQIMAGYGFKPGFKAAPDQPAQINPDDLYEQTFEAVVFDSEAFQNLLGEIFSRAKEKNIVLNVRNFKAEADFAANPKREFRAVWVAYLDWPRSEKNPDAQKAAFIQMLDGFQRFNLNAVIFQIRTECDALYRSDLEPWSRLLTGVQGRDPGYDPLAFAVQEAHRRGMELHAWINPFRTRLSQRCDSSSGTAPGHISKTHPEWVLTFRMPEGCYEMLDPGIPQVRKYISDVVKDIVQRYPVDGIHFDDMFYPYPTPGFRGIGSEDRETSRRHNPGGEAVEDWRRQNINSLIAEVNQSIKAAKPYVRFGVSPFGIWKSGNPEGVSGMSAYHAIYADALAWLNNQSVDYLSPQLYWKTGGSPDYEKLVSWWASAGGRGARHIYPGQFLYLIRPSQTASKSGQPETPQEIVEQIYLNRDYRDKNVLGNVFYRTLNQDDLLLGPEELTAQLGEGLYATPALPPVMPWLTASPASPPHGLRFDPSRPGTLVWEDAGVKKYAIYYARSEDLLTGASLQTAGNLIGLTGENSWQIKKNISIRKGDVIFVTTLSENNAESPPSEPVRIETPPDSGR
jgi:uncharacterized lipoprotein YddW (UPF0748 family)